MEISAQTQVELEQQKKMEYYNWNKKINEYAQEVIDLLRGKQVSLHEYNQIMKIISDTIGKNIESLNINYVLNSDKTLE